MERTQRPRKMLLGVLVCIFISSFSNMVLAAGSIGYHCRWRGKIAPLFIKENPYEGVETFAGGAFRHVDPDVPWLQALDQRLNGEKARDLQSMEDPALELFLSIVKQSAALNPGKAFPMEEYEQIMRRLTGIEYKYDSRM